MSEGRPLRGVGALVTGASSGIGLAVSRALADAGARVAMVARGAEALGRAAREIGGHPLAGDVSSPAAVEEIARGATELLRGAPAILVNAAGSFALAPFASTDPSVLEEQLGANVRGPFLVVRAFLPAMLQRGSGHIVDVGSVAGRLALPGNAAYGASKFALRGLHEVLVEELRGTGVRATLVEPSATDTPLWDPLDPDARDDLPSRTAMLRPEDVARSVLFAVTQPPSVEISRLAIRSIL